MRMAAIKASNVDDFVLCALLQCNKLLPDLSHLLPLLLLDQVGVHDPETLPDRRCSVASGIWIADCKKEGF